MDISAWNGSFCYVHAVRTRTETGEQVGSGRIRHPDCERRSSRRTRTGVEPHEYSTKTGIAEIKDTVSVGIVEDKVSNRAWITGSQLESEIVSAIDVTKRGE